MCSHADSRPITLAGGVCLSLSLACGPVHAQEGGWNTARTIQLIEQAQVRRAMPVRDSVIRNYEATAEGHIYFFVDREDGGEPIPLRVDQVALDLYWAAPSETKQIIRAMRGEELLPIKNFSYYLDRLTAIQNGFGEEIQVGEGRDVRAVPHPLSMLGPAFYDFRIADSLTLTLPGTADPIRVYTLEVRPKNLELPGFVGTVELDRNTADIVRMTFSFTPASYVDRRVDNIQITLEHALWEGVAWLPYRQRIEVRREIPELDISMGTIIRAVLRVGSYRFNVEQEEGLYEGRRVTFPGDLKGDTTRFRVGLHAGLADQGLIPRPLEEVMAGAREMIRRQAVSGLPGSRFYAPNFSSLFRANRAEGVRVGLGASRAAGDHGVVRFLGGYAFGAKEVSGLARATFDPPASSLRWTLEAYGNRLRDMGPRPGASGAVNSISALIGSADFLDPYYADGGSVAASRSFGPGHLLRGHLTVEWHHPTGQAWDVGPTSDEVFRRIRVTPRGVRFALGATYNRSIMTDGGWRWSTELQVESGHWTGQAFLRTLGWGTLSRRSEDLSRSGTVTFGAGVQAGAMPAHQLFVLGGRTTLPGHPYRAYGGRHFGLLTAEVSQQVVRGWISARAFGGAGATSSPVPYAPIEWGLESTSGLKAGVGIGVALVHDVLRIDWGHGLGERGVGEWILTVAPAFWRYL